MKKLSKILALSLALTLTFGMTVFAADSPAADAAEWAQAATGTEVKDPETGDTIEVDVLPTDVAVVKAVEDAVKEASDNNALIKAVKEVADFSKSTVDLCFVIDIVPVGEITSEVEVIIPFKGEAETADKKYVLMHEVGTDNWVPVDGAKVADGFVTFKTSSFSNYALFLVAKEADTVAPAPNPPAPTPAPTQPTSPATGETVPVAGFAALILLAGAAVCAKKVKFNN